jgi:hypothetical protein
VNPYGLRDDRRGTSSLRIQFSDRSENGAVDKSPSSLDPRRKAIISQPIASGHNRNIPDVEQGLVSPEKFQAELVCSNESLVESYNDSSLQHLIVRSQHDLFNPIVFINGSRLIFDGEFQVSGVKSQPNADTETQTWKVWLAVAMDAFHISSNVSHYYYFVYLVELWRDGADV